MKICVECVICDLVGVRDCESEKESWRCEVVDVLKWIIFSVGLTACHIQLTDNGQKTAVIAPI